MRIDKLITDLHNLPKEKTSINFESDLNNKILLFENTKNLKTKKKLSFGKLFSNPILAPGFSIILVAFLIFFSLETNNFSIIPEGDEAAKILKESPGNASENIQKNLKQQATVKPRQKRQIQPDEKAVILPEGLTGVSLDNDNYYNSGVFYHANLSAQPLEITLPQPPAFPEIQTTPDKIKQDSIKNMNKMR